jgi:hypothetical protein
MVTCRFFNVKNAPVPLRVAAVQPAGCPPTARAGTRGTHLLLDKTGPLDYKR